MNDEECVWSYQGYRLDKGNFTTAMVHLYRAEVSRANLWRNRLDITTNWSVVTTAAALTFTFSDPQNPHFVLLLVLMLVLNFLNIEARRYSYYALWHYRVRLMETDFFARMVAPPFRPRSDWGDLLNETLMEPAFLITRWEAIANRYRRNYIWLITLIIFSWGTKLIMHPTLAASTHEVVARAAFGDLIPGYWVVLAVGAVYVSLSLLTLVVTWRRARTPYQRKQLRRLLWPSTSGASASHHKQGLHMAVVITVAKDAISRRVMQELSRGVTALEGTGMYTGEPRAVLLCAITDIQVPRLEAIVRELDKDAFLMVTEVSEIRGKGFESYEPPE